MTDIEEADYGCEERMPGQPLMVIVSVECEDGRYLSFPAPDEMLLNAGIDVGDEWPDDIDEAMEADEEDEQILLERINRMGDFMNNYYDAVDEMNE